jgi:uncharacterized protein
MDIKMTGASGYLGQVISDELRKKNIGVSGIDRQLLYEPVEKLSNEIKNASAVINLAGAPVLMRWNDKNKKLIYDSRVLTVNNLVRAINGLSAGQRPEKVISVSAIGIYTSGKMHTEKSDDLDNGFLGALVHDWEYAWNDLAENVGLTIFRLAPVLGKDSSIIKKMLLPFKLGLGGRIGDGKQPFPFIHESDVSRAFIWALENSGTNGIYNLAAPGQINNNEFTQTMAKILHRPAIIPIPDLVLKLMYGKAAGMLTDSPSVVPQNLREKGFEFNFPTIKETLKEILYS